MGMCSNSSVVPWSNTLPDNLLQGLVDDGVLTRVPSRKPQWIGSHTVAQAASALHEFTPRL